MFLKICTIFKLKYFQIKIFSNKYILIVDKKLILHQGKTRKRDNKHILYQECQDFIYH